MIMNYEGCGIESVAYFKTLAQHLLKIYP